MKEYKRIEWTDTQVSNFWDYESQFPENYFTFQVGENVVKELKGYYRNAQNALDYGAGLGFTIPHLINQNLRVSALEFSQESLNILNKKFEGEPNFEGAYTFDSILKNRKKYDLILVNEVVEHLTDHYLNLTMNNLKRLLSRNGVVIITTPNDEDLSKNMVYCANCEHIFHRWQHLRSWNIVSLTRYVKKNGFKVVDSFSTDFCYLPLTKRRDESILDKVKNKIKPFQSKQGKLPHLVVIMTL